MSGSENPKKSTYKWPEVCKLSPYQALHPDKGHGLSNRKKQRGATSLTARKIKPVPASASIVGWVDSKDYDYLVSIECSHTHNGCFYLGGVFQ